MIAFSGTEDTTTAAITGRALLMVPAAAGMRGLTIRLPMRVRALTAAAPIMAGPTSVAVGKQGEMQAPILVAATLVVAAILAVVILAAAISAAVVAIFDRAPVSRRFAEPRGSANRRETECTWILLSVSEPVAAGWRCGRPTL